MLTIFATAKSFRGHTGIIQRNALQSWKALHPEIEIILFGNDEGAAEAARQFGLRHEPHVERNEWGTKRLDYLFARAQAIARHDTLCYVNCDIILMQDFWCALERVRAVRPEFLMVGRRWDTDITAPLLFGERQSPDWRARGLPASDSQSPDWRVSDWQSAERQAPHWKAQARQAPHWENDLRALALRHGRRRTAEWIDYFAFSRGLYGPGMPPFVLRVFWDNWLVWKALDSGKPVIDASRAVVAVHQNHDYSYHPQGKAGVWSGEEAGLNAQLSGGWRHLRTIADATEFLSPEKLKRNALRHLSTIKRYNRQAARVLLYGLWHPVWLALLNLTRPLRRSLRHSPRTSPGQNFPPP